MDSWRQSMGTEGCSSSESGWTMYIASPMEEDDCSNIENEANEDGFYGDNNNNNNRRKRLVNKRDEEDSDDSMASDASSGPTHHNGSASANKKDNKDHAVAGKSCSSSRNIASKHDKKRLESRSK